MNFASSSRQKNSNNCSTVPLHFNFSQEFSVLSLNYKVLRLINIAILTFINNGNFQFAVWSNSVFFMLSSHSKRSIYYLLGLEIEVKSLSSLKDAFQSFKILTYLKLASNENETEPIHLHFTAVCASKG